MALTWDLRTVKDSESLWSDENAPVTESLIFLTMIIGMDEITDANADEFYERVHAYELLVGTARMAPKGPDPMFTADEVRKYVGLKTNATRMTQAKFDKHLMTIWRTHRAHGRGN